MPVYIYRCGHCQHTQEAYRQVSQRHAPFACEICTQPTKKIIAPVHSTEMNYQKEILSDAMGVPAGQVNEHRKTFPNIPITDDGRVIVRSHAERKRFLKQLGMRDKDSFC
jgi:putative FmdB family regulatory protein